MLLKQSKQLYAHIDCNCFFVSCERIRNPKLQSQPVVVANDIVLASSYEARKMGIYTGTPVWTAKKLGGESLVIISSDFSFYQEISQKFFGFLRQFFSKIEPFSIDETFAVFSNSELFEDGDVGEQYILFLQKTIFDQIGIPVSIGVSNTRIRSKILSDVHKPYGYCIGVSPYWDGYENATEFFKTRPVGDVPFIGKGTREKLGPGIRTIYDFIQLPYFLVQRMLGKNGTTLWLELQGIDVWKNDPKEHSKSIVRSRSYSNAITDRRDVIWTRLCSNFDAAYCELMLSGTSLREIGVLFRMKDFTKKQKIYDFGEPVNDRKILIGALKDLFLQSWEGGLYRTTGVFFGKLSLAKPRQLSLFSESNITSESDTALQKTVVNLQSKFGKNIVYFGVYGTNMPYIQKSSQAR